MGRDHGESTPRASCPRRGDPRAAPADGVQDTEASSETALFVPAVPEVAKLAGSDRGHSGVSLRRREGVLGLLVVARVKWLSWQGFGRAEANFHSFCQCREREIHFSSADNPIAHSAHRVQRSQRLCLLAKPSQIFVENILKCATPDHGHMSTNTHFIT